MTFSTKNIKNFFCSKKNSKIQKRVIDPSMISLPIGQVIKHNRFDNSEIEFGTTTRKAVSTQKQHYKKYQKL